MRETLGTVTPDAILSFWFEALSPEQHFKRDDTTDAAIRARFGGIHDQLAASVPPEWQETPRALLASIIILDQFSRNIYRDDARAFSHDTQALSLARIGIEHGFDESLSVAERQFFYMPFMHSEMLADVEYCTAMMQKAGHEEGETFARRHADVIRRFGRYPARNAALGLDNTAAEAAFLRENPAGL
jgi:uncharacterized protein (DUF924 family)